MLTEQEKRRHEQLEALYSKSARRAAVAGEQAVKEATAKKKEFEFRLVRVAGWVVVCGLV